MSHFLDMLEELKINSVNMSKDVEVMVTEACTSLVDPASDHVAIADSLEKKDEDIDRLENEIEKKTIELMALYQPVGIDIRRLCAILKVNNDIERIGDCAVNIAKRCKHNEVQDLVTDNIRELVERVKKILHKSFSAYENEGKDQSQKVIRKEDKIDRLYGEILKELSHTEISGRLAPVLGLVAIAKNLERIGDHSTNIAEDVIYLVTGEVVRHGGIDEI